MPKIEFVADFEKHFKRLCRLEKQTFPEPVYTDETVCEQTLRPKVRTGRYFAWDVFSNGRCVASASFWVSKARGGPLFATLNSACIRKTHRGQGLYNKLLSARINKIKDLGLLFFEVQCAADNTPMVSFWMNKVKSGAVRYEGHYFHNYYSWEEETKMLKFRGYLKEWK